MTLLQMNLQQKIVAGPLLLIIWDFMLKLLAIFVAKKSAA
jgi:hypothetical protein